LAAVVLAAILAAVRVVLAAVWAALVAVWAALAAVVLAAILVAVWVVLAAVWAAVWAVSVVVVSPAKAWAASTAAKRSNSDPLGVDERRRRVSRAGLRLRWGGYRRRFLEDFLQSLFRVRRVIL
jgi:hypothetical protein